MSLERDLHDLLFTHDCVIVPRFGGFLTHYRSARLDEQRQLVHPPGKDLSFNRHLTRTDGLLTDHVARREGVGFVAAGALIDGEVDAWQGKLDRDGRLELPRIGTFYRDAERNLQFDPDRRVNFLKDAYGLRSVPAVAVVAPVPVKVAPILPLRPATPAAPPPQEEDQAQPRRRLPFLWAAATVATVLATAATWYAVASREGADLQWSSLDPFSSHGPAQYTPRLNAGPMVVAPLDTSSLVIPEGAHGLQELPVDPSTGTTLLVDLGADTVPAVPPVLAQADTTHVSVQDVRTRYHVIGGCFQEKANADSFVADLQAKGFAASIVDHKGGLYRVAYGSYPQRAMAIEALNAVRKEEAPQAWLLVR